MVKIDYSGQKVKIDYGNLGEMHLEKCCQIGNVEIYNYISELVSPKDPEAVLPRLLYLNWYDEFGVFEDVELINQRKLDMIDRLYKEHRLVIQKDKVLNSIEGTFPEALVYLLDNKLLNLLMPMAKDRFCV